MKKYFFYVVLFLSFSCNKDDGVVPDKFKFNYNLHSSLPQDWIDEFNKIMVNLNKHIPVKPTSYFPELDIYAWKSDAGTPYNKQIGNANGACICGNNKERYMVLEIPAQEFSNPPHMHRYSVIPHEVFHAYQMGLSENFFKIGLKWMAEGAAASFESLYIQQYYSYDYFTNDQSNIDVAVNSTPEIYESYDSNGPKDQNYASSVFMVLALVKELQKQNISEEKAFKMIYKDFWEKNADDNNWKTAFKELFSISVDDFYNILKDGKSYSPTMSTVKPSSSLKLENIFL
jgi:hypothetical protein|tara:strand:- start:379 stop:1239 length:861 start_codon:yes stop_codon:yes gene_type:complete